MIISRTPLRVSFFGGGTDYPAWYLKHGGLVVSTSINKYVYITCRYFPNLFGYKYRFIWSRIELLNDIEETKHPGIRESVKFLNIADGLEIVYLSHLPARSGLGSSSAFTVGLLHALEILIGKTTTKYQLALEAINVEQKHIQYSVGSQDQIATAMGGLNKIEFKTNGTIDITPLMLNDERLRDFENRLMLFLTDVKRAEDDIAREEIENIAGQQKDAELKEMSAMVYEGIEILRNDERNLDDFGKLLHESWLLKKKLSSKISNSRIDEIYEVARNAGALGGKIVGAGGGGFILLCTNGTAKTEQKIRESLKNLEEVPFQFENTGTQIILNDPEYYAAPFM